MKQKTIDDKIDLEEKKLCQLLQKKEMYEEMYDGKSKELSKRIVKAHWRIETLKCEKGQLQDKLLAEVERRDYERRVKEHQQHDFEGEFKRQGLKCGRECGVPAYFGADGRPVFRLQGDLGDGRIGYDSEQERYLHDKIFGKHGC